MRLLLLSVCTTPYPFLATANARRILTAFIAVAFITVFSRRDAFLSAGEAMALSASPDSKHYHMYQYQNLSTSYEHDNEHYHMYVYQNVINIIRT